MLKFTAFAEPGTAYHDTLALPYESRRKSRLLARTEGGLEVGLFMPRGTVLRGGDLVTGPDGGAVLIRAAPEPVSVARTGDSPQLARAAYHLGNRHVALQVEPGELRYLADHVLDEMVRRLGLDVSHESAPFEPEPGAYSGHGH